MLKVLPIQSKLQQEELCLRCGVTYNPDLLAYAAYDDATLLGICQFKLTNEGGILYDLSPAEGTSSFEGLFIMGRGTLNFIDLCGVRNAFFRGEVKDERLLLAIGFQKTTDGEYKVNLEGFFTAHDHDSSPSTGHSNS